MQSEIKLKILLPFLFFSALADPVSEWGAFEVMVRDQQILKPEARKRFRVLYDSLLVIVPIDSFSRKSQWTFPVSGYSKKDIGKNGFRPDIRYGSSPIKGYDFFDGNRHGGHPAYDIFIRDSNHDRRDDRTGIPVAIVAPVDVLVLSVNTGWQSGSEIRGGNYIWALHPPKNLLLYFAHLDSIMAVPGRFCRAGDTLATMGRTGKNAAPKRSPTHLHFMVLEAGRASIKPVDWWGRVQ
jgi:murein DD-endopeptidase MepM/ murein hydrolase activator NlpD